MEKHHHKNSIPKEERIILGCKASTGENIAELAREYGTNREFIYQQKEKVMDILNNSLDKEQQDGPSVTLTKQVLEKIVFGCMVICKGSTEDTQEFIEQIFNLHVSVGTISNIINSFADKAAEFNKTIEEGIDGRVLSLMWQQKGYPQDSYQYNILEAKIGTILKEQQQYIHNRAIFQEFIDKITRSSSIVECINSLIRPYIFLKRVVRDKFLDLLQFYLRNEK